MTESRFYMTDPADPDAPVVIEEYDGMCPGDHVRYVGPIPLMAGSLVIAELIRWPGDELVSAVLNDGEYEVNADNLSLRTRVVPERTNGGPCPSCGLVMSIRELDEQGRCNECQGAAV